MAYIDDIRAFVEVADQGRALDDFPGNAAARVLKLVG